MLQDTKPSYKEEIMMKNPTSGGSFIGDDAGVHKLPIEESSNGFRMMYVAALTSLLMAFTMGLTTGYSAPATYDMTTRPTSSIKPNENEVTWIGSILALGAMTGGIVAGPIADKLGRKSILVFNVFPFVTGWLFISWAQNVVLVIIGRMICGISCGVISVAVPMYCVEISTSEVRGLLGSSFQGFIVIGNLISAVIGSLITWRYLALLATGFATLSLFCFITMPESPRWLIAKGRMKQAINSMRILQGKSIAEIEYECNKIHDDLSKQRKGRLTFKESKSPAVYKPAFICTVLMFFQQFSGSNAVLFYSTSIFHEARDFLDPKKATIILGVVQVVATLMSNLIVDRAGRKILLLLSGGLMSVCLTILGIYYYMSISNTEFKENFNWIPLISLMSFIIAFSLGYGSIPWLLAAELVPMRARSTIGGLATFANGLSAFVVTKTFSNMKADLNSYGTFWTYAVVSFLSVIFVAVVLPETKGKDLNDITTYFIKKKNRHNTTEISVISQ